LGIHCQVNESVGWADISAYDLSTNMTALVWVYPIDLTVGNNKGSIGQRESGTEGFGMSLYQDDGDTWSRVHESDSSTASTNPGAAVNKVSENTWFLLGMRCDGTNVGTWVDTVEDHNAAYDGTILNGTDNVLINEQAGDEGDSYYGEATLWNTDVSTVQLAAMYRGVNPFAIRNSNLVLI